MNHLFPELMIMYVNYLSPCFSYYSRPLFKGYVLGLLLCNSRKCMKHIASTCWFVDKGLSSWERFLSEHHWSLDSLMQRYFELLFFRLKHLGIDLSELLFALDTTLVAKTKGRMLGVQKWSAHPGDDSAEQSLIAHHWAILGLVVPFCGRYLCFGFLSRLISGQIAPSQFIVDAEGNCRKAVFWDAIHSMIWQTLTITQTSITIVCDAYFTKVGFLGPIAFHNTRSSQKVQVVSRMRWDAVCFELYPPKRKGNRGPHPKNPESSKIRDLLKSETKKAWKVWLYGQSVQLQGIEVIRKIRGFEKMVKLVVIDTQTSRPFILLSLDIHATPEIIIEQYGARFSIELFIRECKSEMGLTQYQCYSTIAFFRFVQLCLMITALWKLFWIETHTHKKEMSFKSLKTDIKLRAIRYAFSETPHNHGELQSFEPIIQRILRMAA